MATSSVFIRNCYGKQKNASEIYEKICLIPEDDLCYLECKVLEAQGHSRLRLCCWKNRGDSV